jgi:signal transduction histidine kinase
MATTAVPIDEVLSGLTSPSWTVVRSAVAVAAELLRALPDPASHQLRSELLVLARHAKWEVRKAVVEAMQQVRDERFSAALSQLLDDDNTFVRDAAKRALARQVALTKADLLKDQHEELLVEWLAGIETTYGHRARDDAHRVARKYAELLIGEAQHEVVKVISPLELSLMNLEHLLASGEIDRAACKTHLDRARARVQLLDAIVRSLRQLTMEVSPQFHRENLRAVVEEAALLVADRARRKTIDLVTRVRDDLSVEVDRHRLTQAFANILQNAFEALADRARGTIEIAAVVRDNQHVVLTFSDDGCGMAQASLRDAFRLFSSGKGSLGFGLPLARKIIETEHRGAIEITSKLGEGTTVSVVLPVEQEAG